MTELERSDEDANYKPRSYQDQLLTYALKENVIIYLPTGAGKTFIALMAMKEMSKDLEGTLAEGGKRSVFICNTIALARQQFEVIKKFTNLKVACYTGDLDVDNWKRDKWEVELNKNQVFVSTCQIIVDIVRHNFICITDFNLMIFDECHHATGGHPMHQLMSLFQHVPESKLPRVIGLTGLLIKSSSKNKILKELNDLEAVYRAKIVTVANFDELKNVLIYSTKPKEIMLSYDDTKKTWCISNRIEKLVNEVIEKIKKWRIDETHLKLTKNMGSVRVQNPIKKMENLLKDFLYQMNDMGLYAASIGIMALLVEVELKKRAAETIICRNLLRLVIGYIERIRHILLDKLYDSEDEDENEYDVILQSSTPKLQQLLLYLEKTFSGIKTSDIKCLVFVERRHTAKILYHVIKRFILSNQNIAVIPEFMVGAHDTMPESIEFILDDKWNRNVLENFKRNECNLIVASSVLEEGIDVQSCNYVIVYDELKSFRQYVQTKGRARMEDSIYNIMMPKSKISEIVNKIAHFKDMDKILKDYLIGKTIDRTIPLRAEISRQFEEIIPAYITSIGARLEACSAVSLINRYCGGLPNDLFTHSAVQYSKDDLEGGKVKVKISLPLQSTVKEDIWSDAMENVKWGKRSAAFKACKLLHEQGEFSDHLLPITKKKQLELMSPIYFKHWEEFPKDNAFIAGTKRNRRLHEIVFPSQLFASTPTPSVKSYMYTIYLVPEFESNNDNSHIVDSLYTQNNFAILSQKLLPKIAEMKLFMSQGPIRVNISPQANEIIIPTKDDLEKLRKFHVMIFRDLLQSTWSQYYGQDYSNRENSYIIVPTLNENQINWELVRKFQNLTHVSTMSEMQRQKMHIVEEDYLNKIVCTWYTVDERLRYIVNAVHKDLTPLSPFPNLIHKTFASYIEDKYSEKVVQTNSFLIEVQPLTSRINFLRIGKSDGNKKKLKKFDSILLIPELCHNFHFPGDIWLKAKFLPSILHRLHYILLAEEIRIKINQHLDIKHEDYNPLPLIVDYSLPRVHNDEDKNKEMITLRSLTCGIDAKPVKCNMSLIQSNKYKWRAYEEPCDLNRCVDQLYNIELDYYHQFITNKLNSMQISENYNTKQFDILNIVQSDKDKGAICDIPSEDRKSIQILQITIDETFNNNKGPEQCDLLAAITTAGSNDVFDMERLEVLGDSFLKFSISLFLLHWHPTWNEGYLTIIKGRLVSNRNLLYHSMKMKLPGALKSKEFNAKNEWRPPICSVPLNAIELVNENNVSPSVFGELILSDEESQNGILSDETLHDLCNNFTNHPNHLNNESDMYYLLNKIWVSDKVCADSVEAILGVCVKTFGVKKTFPMLDFFGIIPSGYNIKNILNINLGSPRLRANISDREIDSFLLNYKELEKNLGYKFHDRAYLLQALTHPSYPTNRITGCYQQLEFLGDAILDFLITCYIYEHCNKMDPGKLTDLRSALVNNVTLASIAVRHKFHLFILSQNASLSQSIMKFVEFQQNQNVKVTDQVRILILENESDSSMADYVDVPKTLGDIFEAIIGAVFLDSGNNLYVTWNVIYHLIQQELFEFMSDVPIQVVRQLYEYNGADPKFSPPIVDDDIFMVKCSFTCRNEKKVVNGFGKNKNQAKISAAKLALQHLVQA